MNILYEYFVEKWVFVPREPGIRFQDTSSSALHRTAKHCNALPNTATHCQTL